MKLDSSRDPKFSQLPTQFRNQNRKFLRTYEIIYFNKESYKKWLKI